jgi:hypothetical protein
MLLPLSAAAVADTAEAVQNHLRPSLVSFADGTRALEALGILDPQDMRPAFHLAWDARTGVVHPAPLGTGFAQGENDLVFFPSSSA